LKREGAEVVNEGKRGGEGGWRERAEQGEKPNLSSLDADIE